MVAKWWDHRLHALEIAAEHGDSRALHQGVKGHLDFVADDGQTKKALSNNHQEDHEGMTAHLCDILNIEREYTPTNLESVAEFTYIEKHVDWSEPNEDDVRWAIMQLKKHEKTQTQPRTGGGLRLF